MLSGLASSQKYYGKELGSFKTLEHGVRGKVYAVDSRTLYIKDFSYDGQGPGQSDVPDFQSVPVCPHTGPTYYYRSFSRSPSPLAASWLVGSQFDSRTPVCHPVLSLSTVPQSQVNDKSTVSVILQCINQSLACPSTPSFVSTYLPSLVVGR